MIKLGKKHLLLKLELNSSVLYEESTSSISFPILIGRSNSCKWHIPPTDKTASNVHAEILLEKGHYIIRDKKSRNGIYLKGQKIAEHRLSVGDRLSIGDSVLIVEEHVEKKKNILSQKYNKLEQINGSEKGRIISLKDDVIILGSASDSTIVCNDSLISQHHAEIKITEDGCWIRDLNSRNGTSVNSVRLMQQNGDKGRFLQDGDIISISYIDFRFLDKSVEHIRSHIFLKLGVVITTLVIMLSGYFLYMYSTPDAKSYIDKARVFASKKDFDKALVLLEESTNARNSDLYKFERGDLILRIKQWSHTVKNWEKAKQLIANGKWVTANKLISPLLDSNSDVWTWNATDATVAKDQALVMKKISDAFLKSRIDLENPEITTSRLIKSYKELEVALNSCVNVPDYLKLVIIRASDIKEELKYTTTELLEIESIVSKIKNIEDMQGALDSLVKLQKTINTRLSERIKTKKHYTTKAKDYCNVLIEPLEKLVESQAVLDANIKYASNMQFDKIKRSLPLPNQIITTVSPVLSEKRVELINLNKQLLKDIDTLKLAIESLKNNGISPEKGFVHVNIFKNDYLEKVLSCDSFGYPPPKWNRGEPLGEYDKFLGIEPFYDFIINLPDPFNGVSLTDLPFKPEIIKMRELYSSLEIFLEYLQTPTIKMIISKNNDDNAILTWALFANEEIERRNLFIDKLKKIANKSSDRRSVIAGGIALMLSNSSKDFGGEFCKVIIQKHNAIKKEIAKNMKTESSLEKMNKQRDYIMSIGLPGNPFVKQMWSNKK